MGVFHVFKIVQKVSIRAKRLILWYPTLRYQKYSQFPTVA